MRHMHIRTKLWFLRINQKACRCIPELLFRSYSYKSMHHSKSYVMIFHYDRTMSTLKGRPSASGSACRLWTERSQVRAVASTHCTMSGKDLPLITSPRPRTVRERTALSTSFFIELWVHCGIVPRITFYELKLLIPLDPPDLFFYLYSYLLYSPYHFCIDYELRVSIWNR
jgi:hypothetical protein